MKRALMWTLVVAAGLLVTPAFAADDMGKMPMGKMNMDKGKMPMKHTEMHKPMHHAVVRHSHHKMDCSDYAWQSQDMKDCMTKTSKKM